MSLFKDTGLEVFDYDSDSMAALVDTDTNALVDASIALKSMFRVEDFRGRTLKESLGCTMFHGEYCGNSTFRAENRDKKVVYCQYFNKRFFVSKYKLQNDFKNLEAVVFEEIPAGEVASQSCLKIESAFRHEIFNMLNSLTYSMMEIQDSGCGKCEPVVENSAKQLNRLSSVLDNCFKYRTFQDIFSHRNESDIAITDIINEIFTIEKGRMAAKGMTANIEGENEYGSAVNLFADINRRDKFLLYMMFSNLIKNAATYGQDNTGITVAYSVEGSRPVIRVQNRGEIPENLRAKFFEKNKDHYQGSGMGLYLTGYLAELLGAEVCLEERTDIVSVKISL